MDFFGLATLSGTIYLDSKGNFDIRLSGRMTLGTDDFGLRGDFSIQITSLARDNGSYLFVLAGSASVKVRAFGVSLAGIGLGFRFSFDTATMGADGRVKIVLSVRIQVDLLLFEIDETAHFTIGYLQFPKPTYLAGTAGATIGGSVTQTQARTFTGESSSSTSAAGWATGTSRRTRTTRTTATRPSSSSRSAETRPAPRSR
jgi:hypothetical protein